MAEEVVRLYPKLQAFDGEREIAPGISIVDLTGHTPGHIGVRRCRWRQEPHHGV